MHPVDLAAHLLVQLQKLTDLQVSGVFANVHGAFHLPFYVVKNQPFGTRLFGQEDAFEPLSDVFIRSFLQAGYHPPGVRGVGFNVRSFAEKLLLKDVFGNYVFNFRLEAVALEDGGQKAAVGGVVGEEDTLRFCA